MLFKNCTTLEELGQEYHQLAMLHHPDKGGDTATMQAINAEFEMLFPILASVDETRTDTELSQNYRDIIDEIRDKYGSFKVEPEPTICYIA